MDPEEEEFLELLASIIAEIIIKELSDERYRISSTQHA